MHDCFSLCSCWCILVCDSGRADNPHQKMSCLVCPYFKSIARPLAASPERFAHIVRTAKAIRTKLQRDIFRFLRLRAPVTLPAFPGSSAVGSVVSDRATLGVLPTGLQRPKTICCFFIIGKPMTVLPFIKLTLYIINPLILKRVISFIPIKYCLYS